VSDEAESNVQQAVPFFMVSDMEASLRFYVDGLGFEITHRWVGDDGKLRCCFVCRDALAIYREARSRGVAGERPFVGNAMWVTSLTDPDGYRVDFESETDVPEETVYSE
jgi:catechol 2,3-dioxygenase-like lactoylglutathione lyase family enzyme